MPESDPIDFPNQADKEAALEEFPTATFYIWPPTASFLERVA